MVSSRLQAIIVADVPHLVLLIAFARTAFQHGTQNALCDATAAPAAPPFFARLSRAWKATNLFLFKACVSLHAAQPAERKQYCDSIHAPFGIRTRALRINGDAAFERFVTKMERQGIMTADHDLIAIAPQRAGASTTTAVAPRIDWRVRSLGTALKLCRWPGFEQRTVGQAREDLRFLVRTTSVWQPVLAVGEAAVESSGRSIPVRIYLPVTGAVPRPLLVWFHGGGFALGDLETADPTCRSLANRSGALVVSVDYRLAPEHSALDGADDAYAATQWAIRNAAALGCDPQRVAVGGESAGGTLAALVCLRCRDNDDPSPALQVLVYPGCNLDLSHNDRSFDPPGLNWATLDWFGEQVFGKDHSRLDPADPRISPAHAKDHSRVPPALVITAGADVGTPDTEAYVETLRASGGTATLHRYDGQVHGFFTMDLIFGAARHAHRLIARAIGEMPRQAMSAPAPPASDPSANVTWLSPLQRIAAGLAEIARRSPPVVIAQLLSTVTSARGSGAEGKQETLNNVRRDRRTGERAEGLSREPDQGRQMSSVS